MTDIIQPGDLVEAYGKRWVVRDFDTPQRFHVIPAKKNGQIDGRYCGQSASRSACVLIKKGPGRFERSTNSGFVQRTRGKTAARRCAAPVNPERTPAAKREIVVRLHGPEFIMQIANVLRAEMERQGIGFNELARRADLRPASVHDILSGKTPNPGILTVIAILDALGKSLAWLDRERKK